MIKTCGWCKHFRPHKSKSGYAFGYWLGDGKCKYEIVTVIGDTCENWEGDMELIEKWEREQKEMREENFDY